MAFLRKLWAALKKKLFRAVGKKKTLPRRRHRSRRHKYPSKRSLHPRSEKRSIPARKSRAPKKQVLQKKRLDALDSTKVAVSSPVEARNSIGEITHYFSKIGVCVIKVTDGVLVRGDKIYVRGPMTDFTQRVDSLQVESVDVNSVRKGQLVGLKIKERVKEGDKIYPAPSS